MKEARPRLTPFMQFFRMSRTAPQDVQQGTAPQDVQQETNPQDVQQERPAAITGDAGGPGGAQRAERSLAGGRSHGELIGERR